MSDILVKTENDQIAEGYVEVKNTETGREFTVTEIVRESGSFWTFNQNFYLLGFSYCK